MKFGVNESEKVQINVNYLTIIEWYLFCAT